MTTKDDYINSILKGLDIPNDTHIVSYVQRMMIDYKEQRLFVKENVNFYGVEFELDIDDVRDNITHTIIGFFLGQINNYFAK